MLLHRSGIPSAVAQRVGVGTQLALAAGRAIATELGITLENEELARIVGRGLRSGIGIRGFQSGGFHLDRGHAGNELSPTERITWPEAWRILLVRPQVAPTWHGTEEVRAFARQRDHTVAQRIETDLRRHAGEVAEALKTNEFKAFGEQLYQFNRLAGEAFSEDQGGIYSSEAVAGIVEWFRGRCLSGVGQSSWGPTVFAVVEGERANEWREAAAEAFHGRAEVLMANGTNSGFRIVSA